MFTIGSSAGRIAIVAGIGCALMAAASGPAHASTKIGWVWADIPDATGSYVPATEYSYNSSGGGIKVARLGTGSYRVELGRVDYGTPNDVQVSAYRTSGYCVVADWQQSGSTLEAYVDCYDAAGAAANSYFTLFYQARDGSSGSSGKGQAFLWANEPTSTSYTPSGAYQYNSSGGSNTITREGTGSYTVFLPGLTAVGGDVQVSAYGGVPARCKVAGWVPYTEGTEVSVLCFDRLGNAADEYFDLAYALDESFGLSATTKLAGAWAWANHRTEKSPYSPDRTYQYNGFGTGRLTAESVGGDYVVTIPGSLSYGTSLALVTGYGSDNSYCNILDWGTSQIYIACFKQGGAAAASDYDIAFQTAP